MRILADENVPGAAVEILRSAGHDVAWVSEGGSGTADTDILSRASDESRLLVTFDKDFGDLAFHARMPVSHGIVLFRLASMSKDTVPQYVADSLASQVEWEGHFSVISERRIRMRAIPGGHR